MRYTCVMFSCGGTLMDTREDIANAVNQSLAAHGFPPVPCGQCPEITGIVEAIRSAVPADSGNEVALKVARDALRTYGENPATKTRPYPGITELLRELKARKVKIAVFSRENEDFLYRVTNQYFQAGIFDTVKGNLYDQSISVLPDTLPGENVNPDPIFWEFLVGLDRVPSDTIFASGEEADMRIARSTGCYPLGVTWGGKNREGLLASGAADVIEKPGDLLNYLKRI